MIINIIRKFFKADTTSREDAFVWELAEALMWRDDGVSAGAIPMGSRRQPNANYYYDDALYIIQFITEKEEVSNDGR